MIKKIIKKILSYFITPDHALTKNFFICLKNIGFNPTNIIDVGAHRGAWTKTAIKYFPNAHYTLFEPQSDLLKNAFLEKKYSNVIKVYAGVGARTKKFRITTNNRRDSYSFALSKKQCSTNQNQMLVQVFSLDDYISAQNKSMQPNIIKIDAEGWDLNVIKGARKSLIKTEVVLLEAAVMNKYFQNSASKVIRQMNKVNFKLFDITDLNRSQSTMALWNIEMAFIKKNGVIDKKIQDY